MCRQERLKLEVYNEVLWRLKDSDHFEAQDSDFDDQLWAHFNRLPTRFVCDKPTFFTLLGTHVFVCIVCTYVNGYNCFNVFFQWGIYVGCVCLIGIFVGFCLLGVKIGFLWVWVGGVVIEVWVSVITDYGIYEQVVCV